MTSGNASNEPLCTANKQAVAKLAPFCDGFLLHNRPIKRPCDDSVMFVDGNHQPQFIRRSRGFAPLPVLLPKQLTLTRPAMATGADLKNVSAVAVNRLVFLTQHLGNLTNLKTQQLLFKRFSQAGYQNSGLFQQGDDWHQVSQVLQ